MTSLVRSDWNAEIWFDGVGPFLRRLEVTPAIAGWSELSFRSYSFRAGQVLDGESADDEMTMVLLSGAITMEISGPTGTQFWEMDGRDSVFDGPPYAIYLPPHHFYQTVIQRDADCCYGRASAVGRLAPRLITPDELTVETDADGNQVTRIFNPGDTEHLIAQETVIAPGHWSSATLGADTTDARQEVAYYRTAPADGWALQRIAGEADSTGQLVQNGDAVIIRTGNNPVVASPSTRLYALQYQVVKNAE